ncbi:MAG: hypothetical protein AAGU27_08830 [Dehalobacterium sp.]
MYKTFNGTFNLEDYECERIYQAYKAAVTCMVNLHPFAIPKPMDDMYLTPVPGKPGATATYENGIVKFLVPELPPLIRAKDSIHAKIKYHWQDIIVYAYAKAGINVRFNHGFCLIKMYHQMGAPWDADNRVYKYIIDGIRHTKMIPDDSIKHLSYMVTGISNHEESKTEILVCEFDKIKEKMIQIGLQEF